jgi:hypothetical protein
LKLSESGARFYAASWGLELYAGKLARTVLRGGRAGNGVSLPDCVSVFNPKAPLWFKDFDCAHVILSGIEVNHMIRKGQVKDFGKIPLSAAQQFYSLIS